MVCCSSFHLHRRTAKWWADVLICSYFKRVQVQSSCKTWRPLTQNRGAWLGVLVPPSSTSCPNWPQPLHCSASTSCCSSPCLEPQCSPTEMRLAFRQHRLVPQQAGTSARERRNGRTHARFLFVPTFWTWGPWCLGPKTQQAFTSYPLFSANQGPDHPKMIWDTEEPGKEGSGNTTAEVRWPDGWKCLDGYIYIFFYPNPKSHSLHLKDAKKERMEIRKWFISLSDIRGKELSLLHGEYYPLHSSETSLSFLRLWDQSERFITAVNWGSSPVAMKLQLAQKGRHGTPITVVLCPRKWIVPVVIVVVWWFIYFFPHVSFSWGCVSARDGEGEALH